jgi:hypothetical protein
VKSQVLLEVTLFSQNTVDLDQIWSKKCLHSKASSILMEESYVLLTEPEKSFGLGRIQLRRPQLRKETKELENSQNPSYRFMEY